jgi:hypothetical protein
MTLPSAARARVGLLTPEATVAGAPMGERDRPQPPATATIAASAM